MFAEGTFLGPLIRGNKVCTEVTLLKQRTDGHHHRWDDKFMINVKNNLTDPTLFLSAIIVSPPRDYGNFELV